MSIDIAGKSPLYSPTRMKKTLADPHSLDTSSRLFKAFADPVRLRLLSLLAGAGTGEICVCHLHEALELPQPTVSRHLAYLRRQGVVVGRKAGLWVHYRLAKPRSSLHRSLLKSVDTSLRDLKVLRQDHERLARVTTCCGDKA